MMEIIHNNKKNILIYLLICVTAATVVYSMFTFGLTYIHSDNSAEITALDAIIRHHDLFPEQWIYNNGDINFMRIQVFLAIPYLLIDSIPVARETGALLIIICASAAVIALCRKLLNDNSWMMAIPIFWLMLSGRITRDISVYSCMYSSTIFWSAILLLLLYEIVKKLSIKKLIIFCIIEALVLSGGLRWVAEITLPLVAAVIGITYHDFSEVKTRISGKALKSYACNACIVMLPAMFGYGIFKYATHKCDFYVNNASSISLPDSFGLFVKNVLIVLGNFYKCFGFDANNVEVIGVATNAVAVLVCSLVCFVVPFLQIFNIKKETDAVKFFLYYAYVHNLAIIGTAILSSKLASYYMVTPIFMCIIIFARYTYGFTDKTTANKRRFVLSLFAIIVLFYAATMISSSKGWKENYARERALAEKLENTSVEKGYATFWNAYTNQMYSDNAYRVGAITLDDYFISAYYCLVDRTVFNVDECKSFLILTEEENEYYGTVEFFFEKPIDSWVEEDYPAYNSETKELENKNLYIYIYDYDIAARLNNGVQDGIIKPIELVVNDKCEKTFDYIILKNGAITHGPYNNIYKGDYVARIEGSNVDKLTIDFNTDYEDAFSYKIIDAIDNSVVINLHVKKSVDDFDIVLKNESGEQIVLQDIRFE